jgi:hypothetical protein
MHRKLATTAAGLCLAQLLGLGLALGGEPVKGKADKAETCGSFGTSVEFFDTPSLAAKEAKKEQKLVFVLHVSGNFEDPRFT